VKTDGGDRRAAIGDAAIVIVAREGLRSLTHRAVDQALGLPPGSTSYYARTRRQLVEAMVHRLAARTTEDIRPQPPDAGPTSIPETAKALAGLLDQVAVRADDHRARYALMVDLVADPDLHGLITYASPIRARMLTDATARLRAVGVAKPERYAPALVALVDGLLFDRLAGSGVDPAARPDAESVLRAFLLGLTAEEPGRI
jgi:AcrR family transcriptional regulator